MLADTHNPIFPYVDRGVLKLVLTNMHLLLFRSLVTSLNAVGSGAEYKADSNILTSRGVRTIPTRPPYHRFFIISYLSFFVFFPSSSFRCSIESRNTFCIHTGPGHQGQAYAIIYTPFNPKARKL